VTVQKIGAVVGQKGINKSVFYSVSLRAIPF